MRNLGPVLLFLGVAVLCIAAVVVPTVITGCSSSACKDPARASSPGCAAENAAVSCVGGDVGGAIAKYGPLVEDLIAHAPKNADGSTNFDAIEGSLSDAGIKYGECVVADVFAHLIGGLFKVGSGSAAAPPADPAKVFWGKFRAAHLGGRHFTTASGEI